MRLADRGEDAAVERLGELSGLAAPSGPYLVADVDGELWAALPLSGGKPFADPFLPAMEIKELLSVRAAQLDSRGVASPHEESAQIMPLPRRRPVATEGADPAHLSPEGRAC